jgi:hypothetical protein
MPTELKNAFARRARKRARGFALALLVPVAASIISILMAHQYPQISAALVALATL